MTKSRITDNQILEGFRTFEPDITKEYFYGYCRRAYNVFDHTYQLSQKDGLDFYSLAHEYYIQLLTHDFLPLVDRPAHVPLSTWMMGGFRFIVLEALKAYNREFDNLSTTSAEDVMAYVRGNDYEEGLLHDVDDAVAKYYRGDRKMQEIAHMLIYEGFKQKEVAAQLGITASAVNQRYKKIMDEVVTPFVMENYSMGLYEGAVCASMQMEEDLVVLPGSVSEPDMLSFRKCISEYGFGQISNKQSMQKNRITPVYITSLQPGQIFVFGSNLQGIHAGGAARIARLQFGAIMGNGVGLQGESYAIPTMQGGVETIRPYVDEFIVFAKQHPELHFLVTPIGCGIAGFAPEDIAPLFEDAVDVDNISLPEDFWDCLEDLL